MGKEGMEASQVRVFLALDPRRHRGILSGITAG